MTDQLHPRSEEQEAPETPDTPARTAAAVAQTTAGSIVRAPQGGQWTPSPLTLLTDAEFDRRLELARVERQRIKDIQRSVLEEGTDYGTIPGTPKPTLYQPGAQTLNALAQLVPSYPQVTRTVGDGGAAPPVHYAVECHLVDTDGRVRGVGLGSASAWETKHRYRNASPGCPSCGFGLRFAGDRQEWYCWRAKGGCGANYPAHEVGAAGKVENSDPHDLDNTLLKMAAKRAKLAATLEAHAASGIFAQDLDDEDPEAEDRARERRGRDAGQRMADDVNHERERRQETSRRPQSDDGSPDPDPPARGAPPQGGRQRNGGVRNGGDRGGGSGAPAPQSGGKRGW